MSFAGAISDLTIDLECLLAEVASPFCVSGQVIGITKVK